MKILGHRGIDQTDNPQKPYQNTIEAIKYALEAGCDGIEIDVHLSKDGTAYVIHDDDISIRSNFSAGKISELTDEEITEKRVGKINQYKIPKLSEVIDIFKENNNILNIEMKQEGIYKAIFKELKDSKLDRERVIISSFILEDIENLKEENRDIQTGLIFVEKREDLGFEDYLIDLQSKTNSFYMIEKNCNYQKILEEEIPKYFWTFKKNDLTDFERIKKYKNYNIITDYPEIYLNHENR